MLGEIWPCGNLVPVVSLHAPSFEFVNPVRTVVMRLRIKVLRRLFSGALAAFAAFRFSQLVVILVGDPSGASLAEEEGAPVFLALALRMALPIHLTAVALLVQRPFLSPGWSRTAWLATVISGSWLGVAFLIRWLL